MIQRSITNSIIPWIKRKEILFINGPRQVGKTTLMKEFQRRLEEDGQKTFYLNLENPNDLALVENYELFLKTVLGHVKTRVVVFLDEIQLHSRPSNFLKYIFDEYGSKIKLFATGSANLDMKAKLQDSLAGRKKTFYLTPFNFSEFLNAKRFKPDANPLSNEKQLKILLDEYLLYGGLPQIVLENDANIKKALLDEYTATYISRDIRHMIAENHVVTFNNLLIFLAKIMGSLKNNAEISKELGLNHITLNRYLDLLEQTFVVDFLRPYFTNEISRLKKASKVYFFDNGVRNSLLSNFIDLNKRSDAGALFENAVFLHLKEKYGRDNTFYLRTVSGNEVDFVCRTDQGGVDIYEAKYSRFDKPRLNRGLQEIMKDIAFNKAYIVNQNLNRKERAVTFVSFDLLAAIKTK